MEDSEIFEGLQLRDWIGLPSSKIKVERLLQVNLGGSYLSFGRDDGAEVLNWQILSIEPLQFESITKYFGDFLYEMNTEEELLKDGNWLFRVQYAYELLSNEFSGDLSLRSVINSVDTFAESIVVDLRTLEAESLFSYGLGPQYGHFAWDDEVDASGWAGYLPLEQQDALSLVAAAIEGSEVLQERVLRFYSANPHRFSRIAKEVKWVLDDEYQQMLVDELLDDCVRSGRLPPWFVFHVPHASTSIPDDLLDQFLLKAGDLADEAKRFADLYTDELFCPVSGNPKVVADLSRLVVDMERFADDALEPMAVKGLGAIYSMTSGLKPLRRPITADEQRALIKFYYEPHHDQLERWVTSCLEIFGRCLIIDCHSFPDQPFAYEETSGQPRPDFCIGTDPAHTSESLVLVAQAVLSDLGYFVAVNSPFSGAMVPSRYLGKEPNVQSIMLEVNKRLYLQQDQTTKSDRFEAVKNDIHKLLVSLAGCALDT